MLTDANSSFTDSTSIHGVLPLSGKQLTLPDLTLKLSYQGQDLTSVPNARSEVHLKSLLERLK